jgi:hypothetical protein
LRCVNAALEGSCKRSRCANRGKKNPSDGKKFTIYNYKNLAFHFESSDIVIGRLVENEELSLTEKNCALNQKGKDKEKRKKDIDPNDDPRCKREKTGNDISTMNTINNDPLPPSDLPSIKSDDSPFQEASLDCPENNFVLPKNADLDVNDELPWELFEQFLGSFYEDFYHE